MIKNASLFFLAARTGRLLATKQQSQRGFRGECPGCRGHAGVESGAGGEEEPGEERGKAPEGREEAEGPTSEEVRREVVDGIERRTQRLKDSRVKMK